MSERNTGRLITAITSKCVTEAFERLGIHSFWLAASLHALCVHLDCV